MGIGRGGALLPDGAVLARCSERGCCLGLRGMSGCIVVKGEKVLPNKKACDCIIFHGLPVPRVVLVELKSGFVNSGQIEEKFENTLEWMLGSAEGILGRPDYRIGLLLLYGRGISKSYYSMLRSWAFRVGASRTFSRCCIAARSCPTCTRS